VRWVLIFLAIYAVVMVVLMGTAEVVSHALPRLKNVPVSGNGRDILVIDEYAYAPFFINGHGRHPGEVRVIDGQGRVLDSERLADVRTLSNVVWNQFNVQFTVYDGGKMYLETLTLAP